MSNDKPSGIQIEPAQLMPKQYTRRSRKAAKTLRPALTVPSEIVTPRQRLFRDVLLKVAQRVSASTEKTKA